MAAKSEAQAITLLQSAVALDDSASTYLEGAFENNIELLTAAISAGDDEPEDAIQRQAIDNLRTAATALRAAALQVGASMAPSLGRLAGAPNPVGNTAQALAFLNDYLVANSKAVPSRGLTKAAWSAGGSNVGTGRVLEITTDPNGDEADISHPDSSLRIRCFKAYGPGVASGAEQFELKGAARSWPWREDGTGDNGGGYKPQWGYGDNEFGSAQEQVSTGALTNVLTSMYGASPKNLINNGAFEDALRSSTASSTTKYNGITISSGASNIEEADTAETPAPIKGTRSISIKGNTVFYFPIKRSGLLPKTAIGFGALAYKYVASSTLAATITLKLKDDSTTHGTTTITVGGETDNTVVNKDKAIILGSNIGDNLRLEVEVTSWTDGSGTSNRYLLDEIYVAAMQQFDGGRSLLILSGVTPWKVDDEFTASTTTTDVGRTQRFFNRVFGRYMKHSAAGTDFVDPTPAPEIAATYDGSNVADGGTIALGAVSTGDHSVAVTFSNSGNEVLALAVPVRSSETNISAVDDDMTVPIVVHPNQSVTLDVVVTDGGAGAFSTTLTWDNNDASESTFAITISGTAS